MVGIRSAGETSESTARGPAAGPPVVLGHGGELTGWHDLLSAGAVDPLVLLAIVGAVWWYAVGVRAVWRSAGAGQVVARGQVAAFALAILTIVLALVSPLDPLAEALRELFGLDPADLPTLAIAIGVSLTMALAGSLLPAIRAARTNPTEAIRTE